MKNIKRSLSVDLKLSAMVVKRVVFESPIVSVVWFWVFFATVFCLQWLFNIDQLFEVILGDSGLTFVERLDFLIDGFLNMFRYSNDFVPFSIILTALLLSLSFVVAYIYRAKKKVLKPIGAGLLGVGCVACGGSVVSLGITFLTGSVLSLSLAGLISRVLLLVSVVLSYKSLVDVSFVAAELINSSAKDKK